MKKITISFIIITFIAQNLLWATGERVLMPDSKQAMQELASSIDEVQNPAAAWLRFRDGGQAVDDRVGGDERKSTLFRLMIWLTLICSSLFLRRIFFRRKCLDLSCLPG